MFDGVLMSLRIPLAKPEITDADRAAVLEVLRTTHLSMGPKLQEFERAICDYTGGKYAVVVNSGTSALQIAVRALGFERGAEVILPSFTFSALLNVILEEGLQPRFVDIGPDAFNTTPEIVEAAVTNKTRLVLAVHTFGFPLDVEAMRSLVEARRASRPQSIHFIEDACEALGTEVGGRKAGSFGDAGLLAFYPNKQITTGEGGVLITSDEKVAAWARRLRNQGRDPALDWDQHTDVGFSYRLSDINCALGISQLTRVEAVIARRQRVAEAYDRALAKMSEIASPPLSSSVGRISWFVYPIRLAAEFNLSDRDRICEAMLRKGIATGRYFAPLHRQPVLDSHPFAKNARESGAPSGSSSALSQTEFVADRVIALPFFNELTETEIQEICSALDESIRELRRKT